VKGALGVLVGFGVRVGGTSEKGVSVNNGVHVGRGVLVAVISRVGLAVHVGTSVAGAGVAVGTLGTNKPPPGGKIFKDEFGLMKINAKYPAMHVVMSSATIERMSHICMGGLEPFPLNKLFIVSITP